MELWQVLLFGATFGLGYGLRNAGKELGKGDGKEKERRILRVLGAFVMVIAVAFLFLFALISAYHFNAR